MLHEIKFEDFEYTVMTKLLARENPILSILRKQYLKASVEKREFSGIGSFTDYSFKKIAEPTTSYLISKLMMLVE